MSVEKYKGNATSEIVSCQQGETSGAVMKMDMDVSLERTAATMQGGLVTAATRADDALSIADREWERRKWMWQMGTIILMGFSGLLLNAVIKPFATPQSATKLAVEVYCQENGLTYSPNRPADALAPECARLQVSEQPSRDLTRP